MIFFNLYVRIIVFFDYFCEVKFNYGAFPEISQKDMNKFLLTLLIAAFAVPVSLLAQDNGLNPRYSVTVGELYYRAPEKKKPSVGTVLTTIADAAAGVVTDINNEAYVPMVRAEILSSINSVRRLIVVEDANVATDYVIYGEVTNITVNRKTETTKYKDKKGKERYNTEISYSANVSASLSLKEVATGVVIATNVFRGEAFYSIFSSVDESIRYSIKRMCSDIARHYNAVFPIEAQIVERGKIDKEKQKEVYINVGFAIGVSKNDEFDVMTFGSIGGQETRKIIGRLKVKEVMGGDISLCKVNKGDKEIKAALDAGTNLVIVSRQ